MTEPVLKKFYVYYDGGAKRAVVVAASKRDARIRAISAGWTVYDIVPIRDV